MALYSRVGLIILATLLVLVVTGSAIPAGSDQYIGVLVKMDISNSYIVVMNPNSGGRFRFTISEDTKVSAEETGLAVVDLKMGTPVIVEYEWTGDNYTAHSIAVQSEEE